MDTISSHSDLSTSATSSARPNANGVTGVEADTSVGTHERAASGCDKRCSMSVTDSVSGGPGSAEDGSIGSAGSAGAVSSTSAGRVPKKFITTWRHACDKTKDRTKDLFKRWRTLPEAVGDVSVLEQDDSGCSPGAVESTTNNHGWSVHVWATWVKRYPSDEEDIFDNDHDVDKVTDGIKYLTCVQREKLEHFFSHLFDMDRDDLISIQDFESFCERLRRFADWTENSPEFVTLQQVKEGFVEHFILAQQTADKEVISQKPYMQVISLEEWLGHWGKLLNNARNWSDFPIWLQYLPKVLYQAINTSGSGVVTREELNMFHSSIVGVAPQILQDLHNKAYRAMTANGEHPLTYSVYRLCFANFLLGRYPNGPGHYIFGHMSKPVALFPIDYSAMNTPSEELEQYTPDKKSNRRSVMV